VGSARLLISLSLSSWLIGCWLAVVRDLVEAVGSDAIRVKRGERGQDANIKSRHHKAYMRLPSLQKQTIKAKG